MMSQKFVPGMPCPDIKIPMLAGGKHRISSTTIANSWKLIVFYRGSHCPFCANYVKELNGMSVAFLQSNIDVLAISSDPEEKALTFAAEHNLTIDIGFDLTTQQMGQMGLYISDPVSTHETNRPFCEPGLFVLNA